MGIFGHEPLTLDADTQTDECEDPRVDSPPELPASLDLLDLSERVSQSHLSLITRINELEIQNYDIQKSLNKVCHPRRYLCTCR